jgi:hypothetical protein
LVVCQHSSWTNKNSILNNGWFIDEGVILYFAVTADMDVAPDVGTASNDATFPDMGTFSNLGVMPNSSRFANDDIVVHVSCLVYKIGHL